ncbi:magnesium transporter MgtE N-terminal domain-containing protein, partial [Natrialbaceae archaeon A-arb3/5]
MNRDSTEIQEAIAMNPEPSDSFTDLPLHEWRDVFFGLTEEVQEHLIADMSRLELETFIDRLDPDEVTDVLGYTDEETREALLATLDNKRREKINFLLSFDPDSAAGVMSLDYVTVGRWCRSLHMESGRTNLMCPRPKPSYQ